MASVRRRSTAGRPRAASAGAETKVRTKRAYEEPSADDGYRVLVDRLWPRGVRKDALAIDTWMKDIGPSDELRHWFGHDPARWEEFATRYRGELRREPAAGLLDDLVARARRGPVTLVYGAKDELHNQAIVLRDVIDQKVRRAARPATKAAAPRGRALPSTQRPRQITPARPARRAARARPS